MNVTIKTALVQLLIDQPTAQKLNKSLNEKIGEGNFIVPEREMGAGYYQWKIPGTDWTSFDKLNEEDKSDVAEIFNKKKKQIVSSHQNTKLLESVFVIPDNKYIYAKRGDDGRWNIAVTAWGMKFPAKPSGGVITKYISTISKQNVKIAFLWEKRKLYNYKFIFNGWNRTTSDDGFLYLDNSLKVGTECYVISDNKKRFDFIIEEGKEEYVFDLTTYFKAEVIVSMDDSPLDGAECSLEFGNKYFDLVTDAQGRAEMEIPFQLDKNGSISAQPECIITYKGTTKSLVPSEQDNHLIFKFDLKTQETPTFNVVVNVIKDDQPLIGTRCSVDFNDEEHFLTTDNDGKALINLPMKADEKNMPIAHQPECVVKCNGLDISKQPDSSQTEQTLDYVFEFKTPVESPVFDVIVNVVQDKQPAFNTSCSVAFDGQTHDLLTNSNGQAVIKLQMKADEQGYAYDIQPTCQVTCKDQTQKHEIVKDQNIVTFNFEFETPKEQEFVYITLLDYGEYPISEIPVTINLKKKGEINLVTDSEGRCKLPKEWITPKEKIKVRANISVDYQKTHDLHRKGKKRSQKGD